MVGSPHPADDLAQEMWTAVVRGLPHLRKPERFTPWLFTIARRRVTDHLRQAYRAQAPWRKPGRGAQEVLGGAFVSPAADEGR
ncbi:sigma-70 family RNA polymerase sigma factor [Streptomyces sp. SCSIO 30461]|uniref:RNA polymerase sigma factor n=1 Tax=Streptomyces sp. SCSIO 30461 TaxID=3118085 RepID=UPI0030D001F3